MKNFIVFILVLSLLVVGEYYFLTEFFTHKRIYIISASLLVVVACLYVMIRLFKRSLISS